MKRWFSGNSRVSAQLLSTHLLPGGHIASFQSVIVLYDCHPLKLLFVSTTHSMPCLLLFIVVPHTSLLAIEVFACIKKKFFFLMLIWRALLCPLTICMPPKLRARNSTQNFQAKLAV